MQGHTIAPVNRVGTSWVRQPWAFTLSGGAITADQGGRLTYVDMGRPNYTVTAVANMGGVDGKLNACVRWLADNQRIETRVEPTRIMIWEVNSGSGYVLRAQTPGTFANDVDHTIVVRVSADLIRLTVRSTAVSWSSTVYNTNTYCGIKSSSANEAWKEFRVEI